MKRVATVWIVVGLWLSAWQTRGQETDSLFFQPDSLAATLTSPEKSTRPAVVQRVAAESFMTARVHFTGDFIRRFYGQAGTGNPPMAREMQIRALFDNEDARLNRRPTGERSRYADLVDEFVADVCRVQPLPTPTDANEWYAEVRGRVTWQHRERDFTLYLRKNRNGANWAWQMIGAEAAFLPPDGDAPDLTVIRRDSLVFIPPNAHELNFMGLAKQLRSGIGLGQFVDPALAHDPTLRGLAQRLADGQLRLPTLLTTTVSLTVPPGWLVQLRQFNRETDHSGWLISDLCRLGGPTCLPPVLQPFMTNNHSLHKP